MLQLNDKVAFDLDGTIITCKDKQCSLMQDLILESTFCDFFDINQYWLDKMCGFNNILCLNRQGIYGTKATNICNEWVRLIESDKYNNIDVTFSGALEVLRYFSAKQGKVPVITARSNVEALNRQVNRLNLLDYCDFYPVTHNNIVYEKSKILLALNIDVFIGDTESDFRAASTANCSFIGVSTGQRTAEYLVNSGASIVIDSISELIR